jgi:hypothetical protein
MSSVTLHNGDKFYLKPSPWPVQHGHSCWGIETPKNSSKHGCQVWIYNDGASQEMWTNPEGVMFSSIMKSEIFEPSRSRNYTLTNDKFRVTLTAYENGYYFVGVTEKRCASSPGIY